MPRKWYEGQVIDIQQIGSQTRQFKLKIEAEEIFEFAPGQFITMDLPLGDKRLDRWRSYSIASTSIGNNMIDLCIVNLEGGKATKYLFNHINVGSTIKFKGPEGQFVLPDTIDQKLIMICTGTGVAPFRSMIHHLYDNNITHQGVHLIFGTRFEKDILYRDEFESIANHHKSFEYTVCLSREEDWEGIKGYVHQVYEQAYSTVLDNSKFYLCGWSQMVDEAAQRLRDIGCKPNQIRLELYG